MAERPDLPREGPGGRLPSPPRPWPHGDGQSPRDTGGPGGGGDPSGPRPARGPARNAAVLPIAAALVAAGALVDLGSATNDFATVVGGLSPDARTVAVAGYTATLLVTLVEVGVSLAAVAARRSPRWRTAGWGALLALALYRGLASAPILFGELSVQLRPAPVWRLGIDAATGVLAAVTCLAAPPVGEAG